MVLPGSRILAVCMHLHRRGDGDGRAGAAQERHPPQLPGRMGSCVNVDGHLHVPAHGYRALGMHLFSALHLAVYHRLLANTKCLPAPLQLSCVLASGKHRNSHMFAFTEACRCCLSVRHCRAETAMHQALSMCGTGRCKRGWIRQALWPPCPCGLLFCPSPSTASCCPAPSSSRCPPALRSLSPSDKPCPLEASMSFATLFHSRYE